MQLKTARGGKSLSSHVFLGPSAIPVTPHDILATPDAILAIPNVILARPGAILATPAASLATLDAILVTPGAILATPKRILATPSPILAAPNVIPATSFVIVLDRIGNRGNAAAGWRRETPTTCLTFRSPRDVVLGQLDKTLQNFTPVDSLADAERILRTRATI